MSEQNMTPDDGVEEEFISWMHSIRAGRDRWRGRGVHQRRRRTQTRQRTRGLDDAERSAALRKDATARLIAALEAKHYALDIERARERTPYADYDRATPASPEEIRRQATSVAREDVQKVKASQIADAHVIAQSEQLIALGVSAAAVEGMIGQYEQELAQARNAALSTEQSANATADLSPDGARRPEATVTPDGRHYAGAIDLGLVEQYTAEGLDQVDDLETGRDPIVGELIADSGIESGMAVNSTSVDTEGGNVIDLDAARGAQQNLDEGVQV